MDSLNQVLRSESPQALEDYLDKNTSRILNEWSYSAGTSNHASLGAHTHTLVKTLAACKGSSLLATVATKLANEIVRDHLKVIYRSLFLTRARQTVPAIDLLTQMCTASSASADALYNSFDITLKVIPKLLASKDFRAPFIYFYIALISNVGPVAQKDLLQQKKIVRAWLSKLHEDKDASLATASLDCLGNCVLKNKLMAKSHKLSFFSDSTLQSIVKLFGLVKELDSTVYSFFKVLFMDADIGVLFPDNGWFGEEPNNKLTLSFIKILRPWDSNVQMNLCVDLLHSLTELNYPYFEHMAKVYPFIPKVSSFWYNYAILNLRAILAPLPQLDSIKQPDSHAVIASILPQPLSRSHLNAAVTFSENSLFSFTACQIVLASLRKLEKVLLLYEQNVWDASAILADLKDRIPSIQVFSAPAKPQLLQTCSLMCAVLHYKLFGTNVIVPLPAMLTSAMLEKTSHGLDSVEAQTVLELQAIVLGSAKWYNKSGGAHSFFSRLLKFMLLNPDLADSAIKLAKTLVGPLLVMQNQTVAHPIDALIYTLEVFKFTPEEEELVWNLIDEAISRSIRSPYGYIDKYPAVVSPFAIALVEQLEYAPASSKLRQWVASYVRALGVIGEDKNSIQDLSKELSVDNLPLDDYFEFVLSEKEAKVLKRDDISLKITTPLELMATLQRALNSSLKLSEHLLENIPPIYAQELTKKACFGAFLATNNKDLISLYFQVLRQFGVTSSELSHSLANTQHWQLGKDFLTTEFLISQIETTPSVFDELARRKVVLPHGLIKQHLDKASYVRSLNLEKDHARDFVATVATADIGSSSKDNSIAAIIEASHYYEESFGDSPRVLTAAAKFAKDFVTEKMKKKYIDIALGALNNAPLEATAMLLDFEESVASNSQELSRLLDHTSEYLATEYAILARYVQSEKWVDKAVLSLTKLLSESKNISEGALKFISEFSTTADKIQVWAVAPSFSLNALLSALLNRIELGSSTVLMGLLNSLVTRSRTKDVQSTRFLQKLLEQEPGFFDHKLLASLAIWQLFNCNVGQNSTKDIQIGVLKHYGGQSSSSDMLLMDILRQIESNLSSSWVDQVVYWELQAKTNLNYYDRPPLVTVVEKASKKLQVTLCEDLILDSTVFYNPFQAFKAPSLSVSFASAISQVQDFDIMQPHQGYNDEFLLNCIPSCDQIVKDGLVDVKTFCEMGLWSFVVCCLCSSNPNVAQSAKLILESTSLAIKDQKYKESVAVGLLTNKILYFLHQHDDRIHPHIAIMVGQVAKLVSSPSHFLHEKASDWLLSGPSIQVYDLPLYDMVIKSTSHFKQQELLWIIKSLRSSLVDEQVNNLFLKNGVYEWAYTQLNLVAPRSKSLKLAVKQLFSQAELVGGSMGLIKRAAALSFDPSALLFATVPPASVVRWIGIQERAKPK